jgi:hypothetical protein
VHRRLCDTAGGVEFETDAPSRRMLGNSIKKNRSRTLKTRQNGLRRLQIVDFIKNNPPISDGQIAEKFGVSSARVWQIRTAENIPQYVRQGKVFHCSSCGVRGSKQNKSGMCAKCLKASNLIPLVCDQCSKLFYRRIGWILSPRQPHTGYFCSQQCWGRKVGTRNKGKHFKINLPSL